MKHYPLLVANWKMYGTVADASVLTHAIKKALEEISHIEVVLCPPTILVPYVSEILSHHKLAKLHTGVQNIHQQAQGLFTGEISAAMAKNFADFTLVGHSERIKWYGETPIQTNQKIHAALRAGLTPVICVGELKRSGNSGDEVMAKLEALLVKVSKDDYHKLVVAYEPVWAISNGDPKTEDAADGDYAQAVASLIRKKVGLHTRILYGGSTNADNLAEFLHQDDIDGALVGAASIKAREFIKMCEIASGLPR